ncbi:hypothetical protein GQ53DRAFT_548722 [Thozetella sp. PMI_491]|nr:hypothetical protein GQ53DRAFT_548722 [Thozetella sp. PMI_491]
MAYNRKCDEVGFTSHAKRRRTVQSLRLGRLGNTHCPEFSVDLPRSLSNERRPRSNGLRSECQVLLLVPLGAHPVLTPSCLLTLPGNQSWGAHVPHFFHCAKPLWYLPSCSDFNYAGIKVLRNIEVACGGR